MVAIHTFFALGLCLVTVYGRPSALESADIGLAGHLPGYLNAGNAWKLNFCREVDVENTVCYRNIGVG
jgi:hypothetical protein